MCLLGKLHKYFAAKHKKEQKLTGIDKYKEAERRLIEDYEKNKSPDENIYEAELFLTAIENGDDKDAILFKTSDSHLMRCVAKANLESKYYDIVKEKLGY